MFIETKRLIIRDFTIKDSKAFYNYAKKENIGPNAGWFPHQSINESKRVIRFFIDSNDTFAVILKESNQLIGSIGIHVVNGDIINAVNNNLELGFAFDNAHWNHGYATEASLAMIDYAFNTLNMKKLIGRHFENNISSQKVLLKLGFVFKTIEETPPMYQVFSKTLYNYELLNPNYKETK